MNIAGMSIFVHVFWWTKTQISAEYVYSGVELPENGAYVCLVLIDTSKMFIWSSYPNLHPH